MADALLDEHHWLTRQLDYLDAAVTVVRPTSLLNVIDHLAHAERRGTAASDVWARVDTDVVEHWCRRIDAWRDCADFDLLRLLTLWLGHSAVMPTTIEEQIVERVVDFGYWYTDARPDDVVDHRWYWSENHRLIFHTCELLAGAALPDRRFARTGLTGAEHHARAERRLHEWFDDKAVHGFGEWHSDTYYAKDLAALVTLAEFAEGRVARRATAFCDLVLFDLALHQFEGNLGSTHGRSYMRHKARAATQPCFAALKMCFGSPGAWPLDDGDDADLLPLDESATLLARARRYRPPEAVRLVATDEREMLDIETMGLSIDTVGPVGPIPQRPDGVAYDDPDLVPFWWDRGALTPWPLIPLLLQTMDRYRLWDADLFAPFREIRDFLGDDVDAWMAVSADLHRIVNAGLLERVTTITWRNRHTMLSTAQAYRPGCVGFQHHISQATLGPDAVVFTVHPGNPPSGDRGDYLDGDRYWTGSATLPLAVQHGRASVQVYAPGFTLPDLDALAGFAVMDETHAYVPTERFDEVVERDGWVVARCGDGYVGIWSWRPTTWRDHDPAVTFTNGLTGRFDLVAGGGPDNVWIVEVGDAERWGDFDVFCERLATATIAVDDHGWGDDGAHRGFGVVYDSPAEGRIEVDGPSAAEPLGPGPALRFDNPYCQVAQGQTQFDIVVDGTPPFTIDLVRGRAPAPAPPDR